MIAHRALSQLLACLLVIAHPAAARAAGDALDSCAGQADALSVSRIVEIDTTDGPRFGAQYQDASFLEDGEVVLTFDDGPLRRLTQRVLDGLREHCAKATFFIVGRMAVADPDMLKEIARQGHTIGIHTWSHKKLSTISAAKAKDEIELGLSATAKALGTSVAPFFRFPYLGDSRSSLAYLKERQLGTFGIDIDSRDFTTRNPGAVQRTVLSQLSQRRKGVILFHDIQPSTAGAIRSLLAELKARGYRLVHMVPKSGAASLPEYDAQAGQELARKMVAAAKSPLANRSVVWPSGTDKKTANTVAKPAAVAEPEELPWLKNQATEQAAPRPRPRPQPVEEDPWQLRTMGN